jgi:uncharacterized membrane protein YgcG
VLFARVIHVCDLRSICSCVVRIFRVYFPHGHGGGGGGAHGGGGGGGHGGGGAGAGTAFMKW